MNFIKRLFFSIAIALTILSGAQLNAAGILIFDSFTPPGGGGLTTGPQGVAQEIFTSQDTIITNIAEWNRIRIAGQLNFVIWDPITKERLFQTLPQNYPQETNTSWKISPDFSYTLLAGKHYLVGAYGTRDRDTYYDSIPETQNGITTTMICWIETNSLPIRSFNTFQDYAFRLYSVPEPSSVLLVSGFLATLTFALARNRKS